MMPRLPAGLFQAPIARRALHDISYGRPENSRAAIRAAIECGNGFEIDLQLTRDDQVVVFHDYTLDRARVRKLRSFGVPGLDRTVKSVEGEARARRLADNITFEGYAALLGA